MSPDPMGTDPAARAGHVDHPPRMGFFTDTSICIGCKACEVACKEWNAVPEDGLSLSGMSYDNTVSPGRVHLAPRCVHREAGRRRGGRALADVQRRVQALHRVRLPGRVPDRRAVPHRVRHRGGAGRRVQRLRLLRARLPVRRDRPAGGRRPGAQVHAVLRPAGGRPGAGLREGLPHPVHPVRPAGRTARAGPAPGRGPARGRPGPGPAVPGRPGGRDRRRRGVLPAPGRARGLRPAAGPGGHHPRPARHVEARRHRRGRARRHRGRARPGRRR